MRQLLIKPAIHAYDTCKEFCEELQIGKGDLIITNEYIYTPYFAQFHLEADVIYQEKYGMGEPSDQMAEAIYDDLKGPYKRIIAIGGGTIIDISKLFALKHVKPVLNLYNKKAEIIKDKELIIVPTTCGTGSEVTNLSILEIKSLHTKMGLASDEMYADSAIMVPELLRGLPFKFFATSSIDALIHAMESCLSPKATPYTELFGYEAIRLILKGYKIIARDGEDARLPLLKDFLIASNYAGIAFGNAGVAAVHALSYPLGGKYHVPHGEANYCLLTGIFKTYLRLKPEGKIQELNRFIAGILECGQDEVYEVLEALLNKIIRRKPLHEYGVTKEDLKDFTENVLTKQTRLTNNNYAPFDRETIYKIYEELY